MSTNSTNHKSTLQPINGSDNPISNINQGALPFIDPCASALRTIQFLLKKYDSDWVSVERQSKASSTPLKERVVVTGTTGALGSYLLAQLLGNDRVEKIWALNRRSSALVERQRASFRDKILDLELLKHEKVTFLQADLVAENLGMTSEELDEIRSTATIFIHNAWPANFNKSLETFEPSIKGARNLLNLAVSSTASTGPPRFLFTSSYSAGGFRHPGNSLKEIPITAYDAADGIGYGQSKFVTEKLLESARAAGLPTCIIRLGQLSGDNITGSWSPTDWIPSFVATSISVGCIPDAVGHVSWLPLNIAAQCIMEVCTAPAYDLPPIIHISHPYPVKWLQMFTMIGKSLEDRSGSRPLQMLELKEWNKRMEAMISALKLSETEKHKLFPMTRLYGLLEGFVRADERQRCQGIVDVEPPSLRTLDLSEGNVPDSSLGGAHGELGGHTTEALTLVSALDFDKYTPRTYIVSQGDALSAEKAVILENSKKPGNKQYTVLTMPRARRVHQSLVTTPITALTSLIWALRVLTFRRESFADVLLINGPGTCFILTLGVYINRFLGLPSPRVVYVESFARVSSLSLSGKLLQPLADRFLVQWPNVTQPIGSKSSQHRGWLV